MEILVSILAVLVIGAIGWLAYLTKKISASSDKKIETREQIEAVGLEDLIENQNKKIKKITIDTQELYEITSELRTGIAQSITKCGVIRFNPFSGEGGNQSFVVALLDDAYNGVILTSLYSRTSGSRIYAKEVIAGQSEISLTKEEKEALEKAK